MDEPQRPAELREDSWQATPPEVRQFIALLVTKLAALAARLNQNSQNASKPPRPIRPRHRRDPPKPHGASPRPKARSPGILTSSATSFR
jgi:hypothetical protein